MGVSADAEVRFYEHPKLIDVATSEVANRPAPQ
jgi:hypothetical protein